MKVITNRSEQEGMQTGEDPDASPESKAFQKLNLDAYDDEDGNIFSNH